MTAIGRTLHRSLTMLDLDGLPNTGITARISTEVARVLAESGLGKVYRELSTGDRLQPPTSSAPRRGYVDFAVIRADVVVLVIEIDRSDKRFSLTKLEHFRERGAAVIWVRWGKPTRLQVPDGVELVEIPVPSKSAQGDSDGAPTTSAEPTKDEQTGLAVTVRLSVPLWALDVATGALVKSDHHTARASRTRVTGAITAFLDQQGNPVMEFTTAAIIEIAWTAPSGTGRTGKSTPEVRPLTWTPEPATRLVPETVQWILSTYPRAYQWWTDEEDFALLTGRRGGETIQALSTTHQRQPNAIRSRLWKLDATESLGDPDKPAFPAVSAGSTTQESSAADTLPRPGTSPSDAVPAAERLVTAMYESERAWVDKDWERLSSLSLTVLLLVRHDVVPDEFIVRAGRWHLGAILGSGELLEGDDVAVREVIAHLVAEFAAWVESRPELPPLLSEYVTAASEIVAMAEEESIMMRGQLASRLRRVLRPDLAIQVVDAILATSRLNYYATATRGAALCDLGRYDEAIETLKVSLAPYRPAEGVGRVLNALSRAFRLRFIQEGDLDDGEMALVCAQTAWELSPDQYSANTYLAAAAASPDPEAMKLAQDATQQVPPSVPTVDGSAFDRALARLGLR